MTKEAEVKYYPVLNDNIIVGLIGTYNEQGTSPTITFTDAYNYILNKFIKSNNEIAFIGKEKSFIVISNHASAVLSGSDFGVVRVNNTSSSASFGYMDPWDTGGKFSSSITQDGIFNFIKGGYVYTLQAYVHLY